MLYGEPSKIDTISPPFPGDPPIEVWNYDKQTPEGLDGKKPERRYRFIKRGDLTSSSRTSPTSRSASGGPSTRGLLPPL